MCHRGVTGNDQIAVGDDGCRLQEIPGFIHLRLAANKAILKRAGFQLLTTKTFLKGQQGGVGILGYWGKGLEQQGATLGVCYFMLWIALPVNSDDRPLLNSKDFSPLAPELISGFDLGLSNDWIAWAYA